MTKEYIAYCGLNCETCDARLATVNDDEELRIKTAMLWSKLNNAEITPAMINCSGCRIEGPKTPYCESFCPIRKCAVERRFETCGSCPEMAECGKLAMIADSTPEVLSNLKNT